MQETMSNKKSSVISAMFNSIAGEYDFLNHLLSFGTDKRWRNKTAKYLQKRVIRDNCSLLDIACGTGDSCIALWKHGFTVTGADISEGMLAVAKEKNKRLKGSVENPIIPKLPEYTIGNAEKLNFNEDSFDAVTIFFGIRNFDKREECLKEIYRVTKKGGILAIVEFAKPRNKMLKFAYNVYFNSVMPTIGKMFSKNGPAYRYLAKSVDEFPKYEEFSAELAKAGFKEIEYVPYTFGIAVMYIGVKTQ
jgi:demethylmenaquinone methyltransferase / 2-methoxy-6-polyprenyl-1,4-benzoquinol methylase